MVARGGGGDGAAAMRRGRAAGGDGAAMATRAAAWSAYRARLRDRLRGRCLTHAGEPITAGVRLIAVVFLYVDGFAWSPHEEDDQAPDDGGARLH